MVRKLPLLAMVVGLLVASSFIGAAAFTSATVQRDVTVGIEADNTAIIGLSSGTTDAAQLNNGELVLDPERSDSTFNGLNQNATFIYGDNSSATAATSSMAFNITNNDDTSHTFTLSFSKAQGSGTIEFYVSDGTNTATVTDSNSGSIDLASGETAYVVVIIDTSSGTTNIDGTLQVEAT